MKNRITTGNKRRAASAACAQRAGGACAESRVVIRDERKETLASVESPAAFPQYYAPETFQLRKRGNKGVILHQPLPLDVGKPEAAFIDWLAFTLRPPAGKTHAWVIAGLSPFLGDLEIIPRSTGLYGYQKSVNIVDAGLIAWAGKNQAGTIYVSLNSQGCGRVESWNALYDWCEYYGVRITRIDLTHDDHEGKTLNIEIIQKWYDAGGFNAGGRKPVTRLAGDWWGGTEGRTVYIGNRASGKFSRAYEKGKQLGDPDSPWVRFECEFHNKDRFLPLEMMVWPADYLAGAYPCLRLLSADQCRVRTTKKASKIAYRRIVGVTRNQCGKVVNMMLQVHGGDSEAVCRALRRDGLPARLDPYSYQLRMDPDAIHKLDGEVPDDPALDS